VGRSVAESEIRDRQVAVGRSLLDRMRSHWAIVALLLVYLAVGLWYSVSIPLGEAPDELAHFRYIRYIAENGRGGGNPERPER
jgi:hypothetical protein